MQPETKPQFPAHLFGDINIDISAVQQDKLCTYEALLHKWQKAVNLVSGNTLPEAWQRHFVDSAQIVPLIRKSIDELNLKQPKLLDIGSGAGFPALVIAMLMEDASVSVIESDSKKCSFLKTVSRETLTDIEINNERIENLINAESAPYFDIITARALASLKELFGYVVPCIEKNPDLRLYLPKGQKSAEEIAEAANFYDFEYITHSSITDDNACILEIYKLQAK